MLLSEQQWIHSFSRVLWARSACFVDRYDILLAVTDVPFDPKTGAPKMEGLKKIQEDEFPFVIVDQPTKCYCNNNENEVYKSPYLEVKDEEFIRVNQALGRWNTVSIAKYTVGSRKQIQSRRKKIDTSEIRTPLFCFGSQCSNH